MYSLQLDLVAQACNSSSSGDGLEKLVVQGLSGLKSEFKPSMGNLVNPCV